MVTQREVKRTAARRYVWDLVCSRSQFETDAWHAYEVLQALDLISLALSLGDPEQRTPPDAEPPALSAALASVEQPVVPRLLPAVPTAKLGEHVDLRLDVPGPGIAAIAPWPFDAERIEASLPVRNLPAGVSGEEAGAAAYGVAPIEPIDWELVDGVPHGPRRPERSQRAGACDV